MLFEFKQERKRRTIKKPPSNEQQE